MGCILILVVFFSSLILSTIMYISLCVWRPCRRPPETKTLTTRDTIRSLLNPPGEDIEVLLRHRAISNIRLVRAFGITNSTFTSDSSVVRYNFRKHAMIRLRKLDSLPKWQTIGGVIKDATDIYLPRDSTSVDYVAYIQAVVFVTVLAAFFDNAASFPEPSDVRFVTEGINELWTASKSPTFCSSSKGLARIHQYLFNWIPSDSAGPFQDNRLELILPAYETLWRLVAHAFTYVEGERLYTRPFLEFFNTPTTKQFDMPGISEGPSAQDIVNEVLRLHPPTKRIKRSQDDVPPIRHRIFGSGFTRNSPCINIIAADVEALQRSSVWGPSPHEFDALRHRGSTDAQRECFIPFGLGPLKCVASSQAPRLAGMIVGGLAGREDIELIRGESLGSREGWEGWKVLRKI